MNTIRPLPWNNTRGDGLTAKKIRGSLLSVSRRCTPSERTGTLSAPSPQGQRRQNA